MINFIKKLFKRKENVEYGIRQHIMVHVPRNENDFKSGRGKLITVSVTDEAYMPYYHFDKTGEYSGIVVDNNGIDTIKNGDTIKFQLREYNLPVALIDF